MRFLRLQACLVGGWILLVSALAAQAPATPPAAFTLKTTSASPKNDIQIELYENAASHSQQIWLSPRTEPGARTWLFSYDRDASVLMAPDETRLIINNFPTSTGGGPLLYRRTKGLQFSEDTSAKIEDKALAFFLKQLKTTPEFPSTDYDHVEVNAVQWTSASDAIVLSLTAHGGTKVKPAKDWPCVYDVRSRSISPKR